MPMKTSCRSRAAETYLRSCRGVVFCVLCAVRRGKEGGNDTTNLPYVRTYERTYVQTRAGYCRARGPSPSTEGLHRTR